MSTSSGTSRRIKIASPPDQIQASLGAHLALRSFVGRQKKRNEDFGAIAELSVAGVTYFIVIVCDGVSTSRQPHRAAATAALTARDVILAQLASGNTNLRECLRIATAAAQRAVAALSGDSDVRVNARRLPAPKTTFIGAIAAGDKAEIAWAGDCRAYLLPKGGGARTLTRDHSWINEVVDSGQMTLRQALRSRKAHWINRCLGALAPGEADVEPDFVSVDISNAKMLVLASDGFWNYGHLDQSQRPIPMLDQIHSLKADAQAATIASRLVDFACECGGHDNITVAVLMPRPQAEAAVAPTSNMTETTDGLIKNPYKILGVDPGADKVVIDAAWKALSKKFGDSNPDRVHLNEAHDLLSDALKRKAFDESLNPPRGPYTKIGPYRIIDKIAEGGFGVTLRAVDDEFGGLVCVKIPHEDFSTPFDRELMKQEALAVWDLRHYAIPAIRALLTLPDGRVAVVMSYIPGHNLQQIVEKLIARGGSAMLDPETVCWIFERVLNGLLCLHDHKVIHGDVKPGNVIVEDQTHQVALVDYGLSLIRPHRDSGNKGYSEMFASPEHLANKTLQPESDLYCVGLSMIYALGGDPKACTLPDEVPDPVFNFIKRLIVRDIKKRPNWRKENLCQTLSDVRLEAFGRRSSNLKPIVS